MLWREMVASNSKDVITVFNWQHLTQMEKHKQTTTAQFARIQWTETNKQTNNHCVHDTKYCVFKTPANIFLSH
jgi:hypothetical protein